MLIPLGGFFFAISLVFWLWAVFDAITSDRTRVRALPKWAWLVVLVLFLELGALAWVLFGRPRADVGVRAERSSPFGPNRSFPSATPRSQQRPASRPVGPDDDPDFLRGLSKP